MSWLVNWWEQKKEDAKAQREQAIEERKRKIEQQSEEVAKLNMANSLVGYGLLKHTTDWTYSFGDNAIPFTFGTFTIQAETVGINWKTKEPYVRFIIHNSDKVTYWVGFNTSNDKTKRVDVPYDKIADWKHGIIDQITEMRIRELDESNKALSLMSDVQQAIRQTISSPVVSKLASNGDKKV